MASMAPYQVVVFDRGDRDGKGAGIVVNEPVVAESEQAAILVAAWKVPQDKQDAELAPRYKISAHRLQSDF